MKNKLLLIALLSMGMLSYTYAEETHHMDSSIMKSMDMSILRQNIQDMRSIMRGAEG